MITSRISGRTIFNISKRYVTSVSKTSPSNDEWNAAKSFKDIPGPKPLPIIGNLLTMATVGKGETSISDFMKSFRPYGIIAKIEGTPGMPNIVILYDPNDVEKVLRREGKWPFRYGMKYIYHYRTVTRKDYYENVVGLLSTQGEEWYKFRSTVNPVLMKPQNVKMYVSPINNIAEEFVQKIETLKDSKQEMPEEFMNEINKWSLESILMIALDKRLGCISKDLEPNSEEQKMIHNVQAFLDVFPRLEFLPTWQWFNTKSWKQLVQCSDYLLQFCNKHIQESIEKSKREVSNPDKIPSVLEQLFAKDPKIAVVMATDMISAGVDTTSNTVSFVLYHLSKNPEKQEILFEELKRVLMYTNEEITAEKLEELKYMKACIKESARLNPVTSGNARVIDQDMVIQGYKIPKGTNIFFPNEYFGQSEEYYERANEFIPERWLKDQNQFKKPHPFSYLPFGFGSRMCIGKRFAELEAEVLLAKIFRKYQLEYHYGEAKIEKSAIARIESPLKFKMINRTS